MPEHLIVIFDGACNLCESFIKFIIRRDKKAKFKFASAQSEAGQFLQNRYKIDSIRCNTMVLIMGDRVLKKSDAVVAIARRLDGVWKLLAVIHLIPRRTRDWVYSHIASKRYRWFGRKDRCLVPGKELKNRFL
jgi:predicted DCC family thiol-disulfide oxidoreductase YuxK